MAEYKLSYTAAEIDERLGQTIPTKTSQLSNDSGYLTEADKASIVADVLDSIVVEYPEAHVIYGDVDSENNITIYGELADGTYTLKYENEDGTVTEIGSIVIGDSSESGGGSTISYTNQLPLAIDSDGNAYSGGQGWKTGYRLNSSGVEVELEGMEVTGFIPVKYGDVVYMRNVGWDINSDNTSQTYMWLYDSSFTALSYAIARNIEVGTDVLPSTSTVDENGCVTKFVVNEAFFPNVKSGSINDTAYLRLNCESITVDSIITFNERIE